MRVEKCVDRLRENHIERADFVERQTVPDGFGDRGRSSRGLGQRVQVALEPLQRHGEALGQRERVRLRAPDERLISLAELLHDGIGGGRHEHVNPPRATMPPPEIVPRCCGLLSRPTAALAD